MEQRVYFLTLQAPSQVTFVYDVAFAFQLRGAYFVGSVGPQAYRIMNPQKYNIPTPTPPNAGLYLEPYPDVREVILLRDVTRLPARITWIGLPVSKRGGFQYVVRILVGGESVGRGYTISATIGRPLLTRGPRAEVLPHLVHAAKYSFWEVI